MVENGRTTLFERLGGRPRILRLLTHFYADVRQHRVLGPVFEAKVADWPRHLEKIADFWSAVTGGPARYVGSMPGQHVPLGLREEHFQAWLGLWEHNCRVWIAAECADELTLLAGNIGRRLRVFCGVAEASGGHEALRLQQP